MGLSYNKDTGELTGEGKSPRPPKRGDFKRVFRAFLYSLCGVRSAFMHEAAFRQEIAMGGVMVPLSICLPIDLSTKILLNTIWFALLSAELMNSAIEAIVDLASPEYHELAKRAKDMGSGAVLMILVSLFVAWGIVLWPFAMDFLKKL